MVVGWLIVSFTQPSRGRTVVQWLSATFLYGALLTLFVSLCDRTYTSGNTFAFVAFAFLAVVFASGLCVSFVNALMALRRPAKGEASATN